MERIRKSMNRDVDVQEKENIGRKVVKELICERSEGKHV